ncbi:uncharacterized protein BT62DRAFT_929593 [Guyanagaster necrorhizus]|uniref:Uncharacterized protein n=1 Tax=Guyanagaster necrorhizus TaxID=856835 RepID=A0A9P8AUI2_9AGAR|nr:uncharacterized protein BT62DRAFT_929593 [Guyanagaster necrorhizus MCA 3950]KAG7448503.1 hypothetical protein BT62DRAFT_929593 [Guyanagaster necrorhizus MCA 3950]
MLSSARYTEGFISALSYFREKYGEDGKAHFNAAVVKSQLSLGVNERGQDAPSSEIKDVVYWILSKHDALSYKMSLSR